MEMLLVGLVLFFGTHAVSIVAEPWRDAMVARMGEHRWKGIYSLVSLVGLILIVQGYAAARMDPFFLYHPPPWLAHVALLLMLPVFPLLLATYLPGRIQRAAKHPTLVAVKLWALAHLLANGTVADLALFGAFLAWAVADRISMKRRSPRALPGAPASAINDAIVVVAGLAIYVAFAFWLHLRLFGVPPIG